MTKQAPQNDTTTDATKRPRRPRSRLEELSRELAQAQADRIKLEKRFTKRLDESTARINAAAQEAFAAADADIVRIKTEIQAEVGE